MRVPLIILTTAAVLSGCVSQPLLEEGARQARRVDDALAADARMQYDQVIILDRSLQGSKVGKLAVESHGARRNATGTLKVIAQLRNRTDHTQAIEARVSFYDTGKVPIDTTSAWQRIILDANGVGVFEESSTLTAQVAHYLVEIREAR